MKKRTLFLLPLFVSASVYIWFVHFHYRFETIDENKVYKSAAIPPDEIAYYIQKKHIKTVIDLRDGGSFSRLNPVNQGEIDAEAAAISRLPGVNHINIPSQQVPNRETLTRFFTVMDTKDAYPVLILCHHGTGRAEMYSALYRIEYLNMPNEDARGKTRLVTEMPGYKSSFSTIKPKGEFLLHYAPRDTGKMSTLTLLSQS